MLIHYAKILLASTALSPALGAVAIIQFENGQPWTDWATCLMIGILLALLCQYILRYAAKKAQKHILSITEFDCKDQEMLVFLFVYMLPFLRAETLVSGWIMNLYIMVIIIPAIVFAGAFHFNPVMRLWGYRFYAVKSRRGTTKLLISKKDLRHSGDEVQTVRLAPDVYLYVEEVDV